jgi:hypothetical protein
VSSTQGQQPDTTFSEEAVAGSQPPDAFVAITNSAQDLSVWIQLPTAGQLWVAYEWGDEPAQAVYIWHQGGTTTPVTPGQNVYTVGSQDALVWVLASPTNQIKVGWGYG